MATDKEIVKLTPNQWALVWACVGPSTMGGSTIAPAHKRAALRRLTREQVDEVAERIGRVATDYLAYGVEEVEGE